MVTVTTPKANRLYKRRPHRTSVNSHQDGSEKAHILSLRYRSPFIQDHSSASGLVGCWWRRRRGGPPPPGGRAGELINLSPGLVDGTAAERRLSARLISPIYTQIFLHS
jgi:hypothetical protein